MVSNRACLHFRRFFFDLVVQIVHLFVLVNELSQFCYVLLVKLNLPCHVLQVRAVTLQLTAASMLLGHRLSFFLLFLRCKISHLALKHLGNFAVLIFNQRHRLLLLSVLILKLLLEINCISHILRLYLLLDVADSQLAACDLSSHGQVACSHAF